MKLTSNTREEIHRIIQAAVASAGGNWKRAFKEQVDAIERAINQLQPELAK